MLLALVLLSLSLLAVGVTPANPEAVILLEIAGVLTAGRTAGLIPSWNISTGGPCNWDGIDCDDNNNVVGLRLPQRSLAGSIPSTGWDQLDGLLVIQLSGNNLAGSIPADWNLPRSLTDLDVSDNRLNGTIPSAWQLPSSLQRLYLYANDLTGTIPADWPLPDSLQELLLAQNRLSGPLPQPWALPASLQKLWLSENSLGGTLPGNWSLPSGLLALELFKNQLTGSIPASLQLPSSLVNLTLYENKLTGPLPGNWTLPASLQVLFLYSNQLTGTLPSPWALPATLRQLSVAFNLLHGPLPSSWKLPEGLQVLELHSNQFSGTLDSAWRLPSTLHQLVLSNNSLTGSIPSSWPGTGASSLVYLAMDQNALQGPIPADWQLPDSLQELDLSLNALTGDLSWDPPSNLTWLNLSYNKLRGPVRANWALPPALTTLLLNENSLTGTLPAELAVPESMQDIELAFNPDLEGSLPSNWSLPNLKVGVFFGCNFTGPLPEWKVPTTAKVVALPQAGTGFCGEVPTTTPYYQRGASNDTLLDSGPGALPNCTAPECTDCTNTDPGQRLVLPAGGAPYYTSPCATNGPAGALAKCATFNTSGTRAASSCAEGQCYLEASIDGATYYLLDFECGSATAAAGASNFGAPGDAQCATGGGGGGGSSSGSSSSGAIIGVAVGCSVAAVVAGAGLWVWLARRRRAKRLDAEKSLPPSPPLKDGSFTSPFEAADESWKDSNGGIKVLRRTVTDSAEGDPFTRNKSTKLTNGSSRAGSAATDQVIALAMRASRSEGSGGLTVSPRQMSSRSSLSADLKLWEVDFNSLELVKQIGEGSFGRVYMAKWHELLVAVKILLSASGEDMTEEGMKQALTLSNPVLENLHKEAGMMAAMRHPHIVNFLGVCPCPPCVVTEYCSRGSLTDVLKQAKQSPAVAARLDWYQRLQMMMDTAKGMLYLHSHKPPIIHRDLKSPNLLVDVHWRVKVSDFNLSKILEDTLLLSSAQATNPRWLAPEVLAGASATMCSDVYSFGVVLWEMMTWKIPFAEENHWQLVRFVADGGRLELPSRDLLPGRDTAAFDGLDDYTALIRRCWAQAPEDRPTFQEIVDALRDMMARASRLRSGPGGPVPRPSSQPSSQPQSQLPSVGSNGVGSSGSASNLASPALPGAGHSHQASDSSLAGGTASLAPSMPGSVSAQQGSVASTAAAALDSASSITSPARPARAGVAPALDSASSGT